MRAILINPKNKEITEVEYTGVYTNIYEHIEAQPFTVVQLEECESLFIDDEGLYREDQHFFTWKGYDQPLAGRGLILGLDEKGDSVATGLDLDYVKSMVEFPNLEFSHFESFESMTERFGVMMPVFGQRAIFKPKDAE